MSTIIQYNYFSLWSLTKKYEISSASNITEKISKKNPFQINQEIHFQVKNLNEMKKNKTNQEINHKFRSTNLQDPMS